MLLRRFYITRVQAQLLHRLEASQTTFPCLARGQGQGQIQSQIQSSGQTRTQNQAQSEHKLKGQGPEPAYAQVRTGYKVYHSDQPLFLDYGSFLPQFDVAYETWGKLNHAKTNAILLHTGLSGSSHAKSHYENPDRGWWEQFIGPGKPLDTNKFFVICTNILGGCYGSTGPSSVRAGTEERYATRFPIISVNDMVRAQHRLVKEHLGISRLYASVGSSLGGMQSFAYGCDFPEEVEKVISISGCLRMHPSAIASRFAQRSIVMNDPNWQQGFYYGTGQAPVLGMKLARQVATITYRSGPEWESRFARSRLDERFAPALCPDFLVESYLDHQGNKFAREYDANSFLYVSKAMDLFDLGRANRERCSKSRAQIERLFKSASADSVTPHEPQNHEFSPRPGGTLPEVAYKRAKTFELQTTAEESLCDISDGLRGLAAAKCLIIGVQSDMLFPSWQQKEAYELLAALHKQQGHPKEDLQYVELGTDVSQYGHDTFLLALEHVGGPIARFL